MKIKNTLITLFFFSISLNVFSQIKLGYPIDSVKLIFKEANPKEFLTPEGVRCVQWIDEDIDHFYFFNKNGICTSCAFYFNTSAALKRSIEQYNHDYVVISSTEWKLYIDDAVIKCDLMTSKKGYHYFNYYLIK